MSTFEVPRARGRQRRMVKAPVELAGGLFLLMLAAVGLLGTLNLRFMTATGVGPGMMPRATALLLASFGLLLIIESLFEDGTPLERWSVRGIAFILGAALLFAWTIRPLGLVIAGPLAVIVSAYADRDTKPGEILAFAAVLTLLSIGLFSFALRLPIPIMPTILPWPLNLVP